MRLDFTMKKNSLVILFSSFGFVFLCLVFLLVLFLLPNAPNAPSLKAASSDTHGTAPLKKDKSNHREVDKTHSPDEREILDRDEQITLLRKEHNERTLLVVKCLELVASGVPVGMTLENFFCVADESTKQNLILKGVAHRAESEQINVFETTLRNTFLFSSVKLGPVQAHGKDDKFFSWRITCELNIDRRHWKKLKPADAVPLPADLTKAQDFNPAMIIRNLSSFNEITPANLKWTQQERPGFDAFQFSYATFRYQAKPRDVVLFLREMSLQQHLMHVNKISMKPLTHERKQLSGEITIVAYILKPNPPIPKQEFKRGADPPR